METSTRNTIIFFILLLFAAYIMLKQKQKLEKNVLVNQNLQMGNHSGSSITPEMVSYYVKTINDAYIYHRSDLYQTTIYIQNQLQGKYQGYFNVIIIRDNMKAGFAIYSIAGSSTVAWKNVNNAQPNWIYIINSIDDYQPSTYCEKTQYASGISSNKTAVIQNVILNAEQGLSSCYCENLKQISQNLNNYDKNKWNIVCKSSIYSWQKIIPIQGRVRNQQNKYYQGTPGKCTYLIWAIV